MAPFDDPLDITPDPAQADQWLKIAVFVDSNGALVQGVPALYSTNNLELVGQVDLTDYGYGIRNGVLLSAKVKAFGYNDGGNTDNFDLLLEITGGSLLDVFKIRELDVVVTSEGSTFVNFASSSSGLPKGKLAPPQAIGNYVWVDTNMNGTKDPGELGLNGVTVNLYQCGNSQVYKTTLTADDAKGNAGYYLFEGVPSGCYTVQFVVPAGYVFTSQAHDSAVDSQGNTLQFTLASGTIDLKQNAGLVKTAHLGDYVWVDANGNGLQDNGETGINGVTVELWNPSGAVHVGTTTTITGGPNNAPGYYQFNIVPATVTPASYLVKFVLPSGYIFSPKNRGTDVTLDSDANPTTGVSGLVTLPMGGSDQTIDAGLIPYTDGQPPYASVGDTVWQDVNGNGIQDVGEVGLNGVTVNLFDDGNNLVASTTTGFDVNGNPGQYLFGMLYPGNYYVQFVAPSYVFSPKGQGMNGAVDSDANPATGLTDVFNLALGQQKTDVDAGVFPVGAFCSIGDWVWQDVNCNGIQDAGEPGLNNVTVNLLNAAGNVVRTTTTGGSSNPDGFYEFRGLYPGTYTVQFVLPSGYVFSPSQAGTDRSVDSDANRTSGQSGPITLAQGDINQTVDAGMVPTTSLASLGDYVWQDNNGNGIQDDSTGVDAVTVNLYDGQNNKVGTTITDINGRYQFTGLFPGSYVLEFVKPATGSGYVFSPVRQGGNTAKDSDADRTSGRTPLITLAVGANDMTWDAGLVPNTSLAAVGNYVWLDANANGIQDGTELGIQNVTVNLQDSQGNLVATALTSGSGSYLFSGLLPGNYQIQFGLPAGFSFSPQGAGSDDAVDSDANPANGLTGNITLAAGQTDLTWDAGLYSPAAIGNYVWSDDNGNGLQDTGEAGINGVTVNLYDATGKLVGTRVTADGGPSTLAGYYLFTSLAPGTYTVEFVKPDGYLFTTPNQGGNDGLDSDADVTTGKTPAVTVLSGEANLLMDAGLIPNSVLPSISGFVYVDANNNGAIDTGEVAIPGVLISLTGTDDLGHAVSQTTTTDGSGFYAFNGLRSGAYTVTETQPAAYFDGKDTIGTRGGITANDLFSGIVVTPGNSSQYNNFGELVPSSLSGYVYFDSDNDGIKQGTELGLATVVITLAGTDDLGNSISATATTDANGWYGFGNLRPGTYSLAEGAIPSGYQDGKDTIGTPGGATGNDIFTSIVVLGGVNGQNNNFGEQKVQYVPQPTGLMGFVYVDANNNGIMDAGEAGIAGVTVNLAGTDYLGNTVTKSTFTDSTGRYAFNLLLVGTYTMSEVQPTAYKDGQESLGTFGGSIPANDQFLVTTIDGQSGQNYNFGELLVVPLSLACTVGSGQVGAFYAYPLTAAGGVPPYRFAIISGSLPAGLTLDASTGIISGTPSTAGSATFTAQVTDATGAKAQSVCNQSCPSSLTWYLSVPTGKLGTSQTYTTNGLTITAYGFTNSSTPTALYGNNACGTSNDGLGTAGVANNQISTKTWVQLDLSQLISKGAQNVTMVVNGIQCSEGYDIYGSTSQGTLGTLLVANATAANKGFSVPSYPAFAFISIRAHSGTVLVGSISATILGPCPCTISIAAPPVTLACATGNGQVGLSYASAFVATGGTAPYTFTVTSGSLPAGLSLNRSTGVISGTPTKAGTYTVTVKVVDAAGCTRTHTASVTCTLVVTPAPAPVALTCAGGSGQVGVAYASVLMVSGGTAPYTFSITSGSLPTGLTLNPTTGAITGTPTKAGKFSYTAKVVDSVGAQSGHYISVCCSITIAAAVTPVTLTCASGSAKVGVSFSSALMVSGGTAPYTFSITSGSLPTGLTLNSGTGAISGKPTTAGTYSFTAKVVDANGTTGTHTASVSCSITVAATAPPVQLTCVGGSGTVGKSFSSALLVTGGTAPYTFSISSGALPPGLTLNPTTGAITGTPTKAGTYSYTAKVVDAIGGTCDHSDTACCSISVVAASNPVCHGDTGTIGFWCNNNGQYLVKNCNGSYYSKSLCNWLSSSFPYLYGANAGANNLTGKCNTDAAALMTKCFSVQGQKTDAQILAAALACYNTSTTLCGGTRASSYGFNCSSDGTALKNYSTGSSCYSVFSLLKQADTAKKCGLFDANYYNTVFSGINQTGDIQ